MSALKKINPIFIVLVLALLVVSNTVTWNASLPLERRALSFALALALMLAAVAFEVHRIGKVEQLEEEAFRRVNL